MSDIVYTYAVPEEISLGSKIWIDKTGKHFRESYCGFCEAMTIRCPICDLGSCSGGGCDYCTEAFREYDNG